jgi:hypothetical protein
MFELAKRDAEGKRPHRLSVEMMADTRRLTQKNSRPRSPDEFCRQPNQL